MVDAVSVDAQSAANARGGDRAVHELAQNSVRPLAGNLPLRQRILEIRRATDIVYDEVSHDALMRAGTVVMTPESAVDVVTSWRAFVKDQRADVEAFHHAYVQRSVTAHDLFSQLKELARRLERPPYRCTPQILWRAHANAGLTSSSPDTRYGISDLVSLIRFELGVDGELRPFRDVIEDRFAAWLGQRQRAGMTLSEAQQWWVRHVANAVAANVRFDVNDLASPPFIQRGGADGFLDAFGEDQAETILAELDRELSA
jgi:type I restriction enzyme R subunit